MEYKMNILFTTYSYSFYLFNTYGVCKKRKYSSGHISVTTFVLLTRENVKLL